MTEPSYTDVLSGFAATKTYADLPASTRAATKRLIQDTLGCCVAAYDMPSSQKLTEVIADMGGKPEATVLVGGQKLPAALTGYLNAHYGDVVDAEDTLHYKAHISAPVVGAALAVAEREGASGEDLITAVAIGYEIAGRIAMSLKGLVIGEDGAFKFAPVTGYSCLTFGAAAACGSLLRLNAGQMHNAFGISAATAPLPSSSKFGVHKPRAMVKNTMYGTLGHTGVMAALLAAAGFTGEQHVLDGDQGFWRVVGSLGCDWDILTRDLGQRWLIEEVSYKPYPGCRFLNSPIDMFSRLRRENGLELAEIDEIEVDLHGAAIQRGMDDPNVVTMIDACFSMPYLLAASALQGPPGPNWHSPEARESAEMRELMSRIRVGLEPRAAAVAAEDLRTLGHNARMPASIRIHARGQVFAASADYAWGDAFTPETMLTPAEFDTKFRNFCTGHLGQAQVERALSLLHSLEAQARLDALIGCLISPQKAKTERTARETVPA